MAWHATPAIIDTVRSMRTWHCSEFFLDLAQGVCSLYLNLPKGVQLNTNTLTDDLELLGLGSITIETFPNDDNKTAAAAIFRMRNIIKKGDYLTGANGEHDKSLMRHLLTEQTSALGIGSSGSGGGRFMSDAEFDGKTQAGFAASLKDLRSASDNIGTVANDIRTDMLRKPDLDDVKQSVDVAVAGIRDVVVDATADIASKLDIETLTQKVDDNNGLAEKVISQNIMLGKKAGVEMQLAAERARATAYFNNWDHEVRAHKETKYQMEQLRTTMRTERLEELAQARADFNAQLQNLVIRDIEERAAMRAELAHAHQKQIDTMMKQWAEERANWAAEREKWASERERLIAAFTTAAPLNKRARPEEADA